MRALGDFVRFGGLFTFALCLARCSGTSETENAGDAGDAGDAGEGATGGSVAGRGGSSGSAGKAGSGGSAGTAGRGGGGGMAGGAGIAGSGGSAGRAGDGGTAGTVPGKNGGQGGDGGAPIAGASGEAGADGEGGEAGAIGEGEGGGGSAGESPEGGAGGASEPTPADGDACSTALALGETASGSTGEFTNDHNNASCFTWSLAGPDVAYSFSVPPLSRYTVLADPSDGFDVALYAITPPAENCTAVPTCAAGADRALEGQNETLVIDNYENEWRSYFLMVDGYGTASGQGTYDLTASSAPIPDGEVCERAVALTLGEPITATLDGFAPDYTGRPTCISASAQGADFVYSVSVPAGNTLTIVATPAGNMDVALYAFDAATAAECHTATTCLAAADLGFGGDEETLTYVNTGATRNVFVHVDRFDLGTELGDYTLEATLTPNP